MRERDELIAEIRLREERLRDLEQEAATLRVGLDATRDELRACDEPPQRRLPIATSGTPARPAPTPSTSAQKVALFRDLFRGRTDVFPKYWENAKTQKKGYSPACANDGCAGCARSRA